MPKRAPNVPDSELEVLKVLWERGESTVRDALRVLEGSGKTWSYATVATLLDRLESKGFVTSRREGLAYVYKAAVAEEEIRERRVRNLVGNLYQGEPGLLVLHLLKTHALDSEQLREARALLEKMAGDPGDHPTD